MELQNEIIACIWSEELKSWIKEKGYTFSEKELLGIAYHFAPSFEERLRLLQLLADHAPSVSDHASRCILWQKQCLARFRQPGEGEIYELRIKEAPDAYEERYLCASFDTALEMIDKFHEEYDPAPETEQVCYVIEKRKILQSGKPFCEDGLGECVLAVGKVLVSVDSPYGETENGACCHSCMDCANPCILDMEVCFPVCVPDRSPVRYRLPDRSLHYGIHLGFSQPETADRCYIIPLDGEMLQSRKYDEYWGRHWHEHIPCPDVESVAVDALDADLRENYDAFVAWMEKNLNFQQVSMGSFVIRRM